MELRQLRYFVAVAEELHFRRAAARLHISQPPLSQQIHQLESEIGCTLLARTRRRVELTPAGEAFLHDARVVLGELEGAVSTAQRIGSGQTGRLRVNFVGSALLSIVPGAVQRFRTARPNVEIQIRERPTVEQIRAVIAGAVDVGLVRPPFDEQDELRAEVVLRERTVAALPTRTPAHHAAAGPAAAAGLRAAGPVSAQPGPGLPRSPDQQPGRHRHHPARGAVRAGDDHDRRAGGRRDGLLAGARLGVPAGPRGRQLSPGGGGPALGADRDHPGR